MNPDLIDHEFEKTSPYLVGREKVREFSRAVFASNPVHLSVEAARNAGYPDLVAPPTFAIVVQQLTLDQLFTPDYAANLLRGVMTREEVERLLFGR